MYKVVAVLCALAGLSSAHMMGMNNGGWGQNQNQNNMMNMMNQGMMGNSGMGMMGNMGNMGNMMNQMGQMGQGQMGGQQGGRQQGGQQQGGNQGVMGLLSLMLMQNMMNSNNRGMGQMNNMGGQMNNMGGQMNNMGGQGQQQGGMSGMEGQGMAEMEQYMQWKMMTEMADMMMVYMDYKEKENKFGETMEALCFLVNATYVGAARAGQQVFTETTDESFEAMGKSLEDKSEAEIMEFAVNMFITNPTMFSETFFRVALETCKSGESFMKAAVKMEKMSNEEQHDCDKK